MQILYSNQSKNIPVFVFSYDQCGSRRCNLNIKQRKRKITMYKKFCHYPSIYKNRYLYLEFNLNFTKPLNFINDLKMVNSLTLVLSRCGDRNGFRSLQNKIQISIYNFLLKIQNYQYLYTHSLNIYFTPFNFLKRNMCM